MMMNCLRFRVVAVVFCGAVLMVLPGCDKSPPRPEPDTPLRVSERATREKRPRVDVDNSNYDFGSMQVGEEKEHAFVITNKGEADLRLSPGKPTCKCTSFIVENELLKPGESTKATVRWKPKEESDTFRQVAPIGTNDTTYPEISLNIVGIVRTKISIRPGVEWDLGDISEKEEKEFSGRLFSQVIDQFKITDIKASNPNIKVSVTPMSDVNLKKIPAKAGYDIQLKLNNKVSIGEVNETLAIKTDAGDQYNYVVDLKARRPGPLRVLAPGFSTKRWTLNMGSFPAKTGSKRELSMFYEGEGDIEIKNVQSDNPALKVKMHRDKEFKGRGQRIVAVFEVPPMDKPQFHTETDPVKVKIETNVPTVSAMNISVYFHAQ